MLRTKIQLALSAVGATLGFAAFICFCLVYANVEAGMWALLSEAWKERMLRTKIQLALSAVGATLGFAAFICFCLVYANVEAGMWALLSGIKASLTFALHFHYLRESLHSRFSRRALQLLADLGVLGGVAGAALTLFYIFLQIYWQNPILPVDQSIVIRLVWSFMMMKWGLLLYCTCRSYLRSYPDHELFSESSHTLHT